MNNPLSLDRLTTMFRTSSKDERRIVNREGSTVEFKESYNHANMAEYFKTIAAFANNAGGYIIFGVGDKPRRLLGLSEKSLQQFENIKVEALTNNLNNYFAPEIRWDHCTFEFHKLSFGVIYIFPLAGKPCVCRKTYDARDPKYTLREGDIYYRYGGRSERIKYPELVAILDERRLQEERLWMNLFQNAARIGINNAALLDFESGQLSGNGGSVVIDSETLKKIAFIREGEFVETKGKPTLRLVGDIEGISAAKVVFRDRTKRVVTAIETPDIVRCFLQDTSVADPLEYIKAICFEPSANLPVYFYIRQSNMVISEIVEIVTKLTSRSAAKDRLLERLNGRIVSQVPISEAGKAAAAKKRCYRELWRTSNLPTEIGEINYCLEALLSLDDSEIQERHLYIKQQLERIFATYYENASGAVASTMRRAICRIDEVLNR